MGAQPPFCNMKRVLEVDGGDGCVMRWMYLTLLNTTLKNAQYRKFNVVHVLPQLQIPQTHGQIARLHTEHWHSRSELGLDGLRSWHVSGWFWCCWRRVHPVGATAMKSRWQLQEFVGNNPIGKETRGLAFSVSIASMLSLNCTYVWGSSQGWPGALTPELPLGDTAVPNCWDHLINPKYGGETVRSWYFCTFQIYCPFFHLITFLLNWKKSKGVLLKEYRKIWNVQTEQIFIILCKFSTKQCADPYQTEIPATPWGVLEQRAHQPLLRVLPTTNTPQRSDSVCHIVTLFTQ